MRSGDIILVFLAYIKSSSSSCYEDGVEYHGGGLSNPMVEQITSPEDCQGLCKQREGCNYFTWVGPSSSVSFYRNTCWLKGSKGDPQIDSSCVSGPRSCSDDNDECCKQVHLSSTGGASDYQGGRLGYYEYYGTLNGRPTYKQVRTTGTPNYLYYFEWGWWYANTQLGQNMGGIINNDDAICPDKIVDHWSYASANSDWVVDDTLRVTCEGPPPTPSPEECCKHVHVSSTGGTEDYQWTRLGYYQYYGTLNNRPTYKQIDQSIGSPNYLYYYDWGWWYASEILGENQGGIINDDDASCPDQIEETWRYYQWGDGTANDWVEDDTLKVTCDSPPSPPPTTSSTLPGPDPEPCTFGSFCQGCDVTTEYGGKTYCCASDCDHGHLYIWEENGTVMCNCYH